MKVATTLVAAVLLGASVVTAAAAEPPAATTTAANQAVLRQYAEDTWHSLTAMLNPTTNLVSDNTDGNLDPATRAPYTSPTNIGAYMWSAVAAQQLGIISANEAQNRIGATLNTLEKLPRHQASGMFFNWYNPTDGSVLTVWPVDDHHVVEPFLSSVDNGWLAASLMVVRNAEPSLHDQADQLLHSMDFGFYYDAKARGADFPAGELYDGFYPDKPTECSVEGNARNRGPDVFYTCGHYDVLNSEPRIASYIGIALGQIPPEHYFGPNRTFPDTCDFSFVKEEPVGVQRQYLGVPVFEGHYTYRGMQFVPTWGGDMFEALMPNLFVPEEKWGPNSWGRNDPVYVRGQIEHGLDEAGYGYWGFSPASNPFGGYQAWGAPPLGLSPDGYPSDVEGTKVDFGFGSCRPPSVPPPTSWGDGVVTPHASFLALRYAPDEALSNLAKLKQNFAGLYGAGGFKDSVAVRSGTVADRYLALDQGMILGAIGNALGGDAIRADFIKGEAERTLPPLLAMEQFSIPANQ